ALAQFPYLADNIIDDATRQPAPFAKPYIIVQANGIRVGIIGVGNPETPEATKPSNTVGYSWIDPIAPTNRYVQELRGQGIQTIVVVYHQGSDGGDFDTPTGIFADFARGVDPAVDLIVGGHTRVETMARINGVLVTEANHAIDTTATTLLVDPQTKDVVWAWGAFRRLYSEAVPPDPALAALVAAANAQIKPILGDQVATAATLIDRSRSRESKMGNLMSDAVRATYQVDVALQNSGGLRADFNPGPITKGDVFAVLPFGNLVVTGRLKGSDLLAALENGVSDVSGEAGRFVQLSGVRFAYDPAAPAGKRVLWAVLSDGKPVDPAATYSVAANDFMVLGGDGYVALTKMINPQSREQLWEVAANYVKGVGMLDPPLEGRIVAAQAGQPVPTPPAAATPVLPTPASILPTTGPAPGAATPVGSVPATPGVVPTLAPSATPLPPGMPTTGAPLNLGWPGLVLAALTVMLAGWVVARRRPAR
ncbi:MAG TPA: 5'-nucleotidase C-terminal domain-containing protein, partial [Chloroflexia bacterium]|nr:5'-nucleotidase C-terminal domain-containing protein [Chloroflexia bacterium]